MKYLHRLKTDIKEISVTTVFLFPEPWQHVASQIKYYVTKYDKWINNEAEREKFKESKAIYEHFVNYLDSSCPRSIIKKLASFREVYLIKKIKLFAKLIQKIQQEQDDWEYDDWQYCFDRYLIDLFERFKIKKLLAIEKYIERISYSVANILMYYAIQNQPSYIGWLLRVIFRENKKGYIFYPEPQMPEDSYLMNGFEINKFVDDICLRSLTIYRKYYEIWLKYKIDFIKER